MNVPLHVATPLHVDVPVQVVVCARPAKAPNVKKQMSEMMLALVFMWILQIQVSSGAGITTSTSGL
jgi:hypothetical protein